MRIIIESDDADDGKDVGTTVYENVLEFALVGTMIDDEPIRRSHRQFADAPFGLIEKLEGVKAAILRDVCRLDKT